MPEALVEPKPRPRRVWIWPAFVVGLLLIQVTISAVTLSVALSDRNFEVEPDYYSKALHWDELRAADVSRAGWTAELSLGAKNDSGRALRLRLRDREGQPVANAAVNVLFFHHAHATERCLATLHPMGAGEYAGELALDRPGVWEFRCSIARAGDTLTYAHQIEVPE